MRICQALLKYGYSNFSLQILEYCDKSECIKKETHYIEKLKPEYNIQLFPSTPMLGVKHRKESIAKLKKSLTGLSKSDLHKLNLSLADPGSMEIVSPPPGRPAARGNLWDPYPIGSDRFS